MEESNCRIYVTGKQGVGILERVRRPANGRQGDRARGLGEDTYNKKHIQKLHNKPCFFACQLIN